MNIFGTGGGVDVGVVASVDSFSIIPAPGAALLALIGLPIVGWVKRRNA